MEISFDPAKRELTLCERGLDFADAAALFADPSYTVADERFDYPEPRFPTCGMLHGRLTTQRGRRPRSASGSFR